MSPAERFPRLLLMLAALCVGALPAAGQPRLERVSGTVTNDRGEPVAGATVVAENREATPHMFMSATDGSGTFVIVGMQRGTWNFSVSAPGYLLSTRQAKINRESSGPSVKLVLKRGLGAAEGPAMVTPLTGVDITKLQTALQNADTLLAAGQYDQAIAAYRDIQRKLPVLTLVNLQIGNALRMKKDYDRAVEAYRQALVANPDHELTMEAIGALEVERGRLDAAEEVLSASARRPQPGRGTLCGLGDVKAAKGERDAAESWYRKCAAADPAWVKPVLRLGLLSAERQDVDSAVNFLEQAIRMAPGSPEAAQAGRVLREIKKR